MLGLERWHGFGCYFNISYKVELDAQGVEWLGVAANEQRSLALAAAVPTAFSAAARVSGQMRLLEALAKEKCATRAIEPGGFGTRALPDCERRAAAAAIGPSVDVASRPGYCRNLNRRNRVHSATQAVEEGVENEGGEFGPRNAHGCF